MTVLPTGSKLQRPSFYEGADLNFLEIKKRVRNIVGDEAGVFIEDEELGYYVNDGYYDMCRRTKLLRSISTINIVNGTSEYVLPAGFINEKRVTINNLRIRKTTIESIDTMDPSKDDPAIKGDPMFYYFRGLFLGLYPTPIASITGGMKLDYVRLPAAVLAADGDIPELPADMHEDIVVYAIARCREQSEDFQVAQTKMAEYAGRANISTEQAQNLADTTYPSIRDVESEFDTWFTGPYI